MIGAGNDRHGVIGEEARAQVLAVSMFRPPQLLGHEGRDFLEFINPDSLETLSNALVHHDFAAKPPGERVQFERTGYFCVDTESTPTQPIINRTIGLRDSWAKIAAKGKS